MMPPLDLDEEEEPEATTGDLPALDEDFDELDDPLWDDRR